MYLLCFLRGQGHFDAVLKLYADRWIVGAIYHASSVVIRYRLSREMELDELVVVDAPVEVELPDDVFETILPF